MQTSVPNTLQLELESEATRKLYGMDVPETAPFAEQCLAARRLVERGVRYVQIFHGGGGGEWDAHSEIKSNHTRLSTQVDQPIAGLLKDLKQRGLLQDTLVMFGTELGFHAVEDRHYITDILATVLHCLDLDSHRLEIPGRKRLDMDHGSKIESILA